MNIKNTGSRTGDEVVQLYVKHLDSAVARPLQEIRGFRRITLKPQERRTVQIPLQAETLAYWNVDKHSFVVEEGRIQIRVGASSADIKQEETIEVVQAEGGTN